MSSSWKQYYPSYCVAAPEMSPGRVNLVQTSWAQIKGHATAGLQGKPDGYFGERFYDILFERYPATKAMFKDPRQQARALSKMLSAAIGLLRKDLDAVVVQLRQLAARHHRYGVKPEHYGPVGECLVAAITEVMGDELHASTGEAWVHLYSTICTVMIPVTYEMCMKELNPTVHSEE